MAARIRNPERISHLFREQQQRCARALGEDALALVDIADAGTIRAGQRARVGLLRAQIAFASRRGDDAPLLLLEAARELERTDPKTARATYLDAFSAARFAGPLARGADLVMVKPAGPYLDVIRQVRDAVHVPLVAYQVSGEFSLIKAAAARGWIDERLAALETLTGIKRAGADLIISYFAPQVAQWLRA